MVLAGRVRSNQISGNAESQRGSLQISLRDHLRDLLLDLGAISLELIVVAPGESLKALKSIQLQLALTLIQQVQKSWQMLA